MRYHRITNRGANLGILIEIHAVFLRSFYAGCASPPLPPPVISFSAAAKSVGVLFRRAAVFQLGNEFHTRFNRAWSPSVTVTGPSNSRVFSCSPVPPSSRSGMKAQNNRNVGVSLEPSACVYVGHAEGPREQRG